MPYHFGLNFGENFCSNFEVIWVQTFCAKRGWKYMCGGGDGEADQGD